MMINNVTLVGRLTATPELKHTQTGVPVVTGNIAIDRNFKNAQGETETDFVQVVAWRQDAEAMAQFSVKGSVIGITGRVQTRNYQNNAGQTVYVTEIVADSFQALETKAQTDARRAKVQDNQQQSYGQQGAGRHNQMQGGTGGFNQSQGQYNQTQNKSQGGYDNQQQQPFNQQNNQGQQPFNQGAGSPFENMDNSPFSTDNTANNPFSDISSDGLPFADA